MPKKKVVNLNQAPLDFGEAATPAAPKPAVVRTTKPAFTPGMVHDTFSRLNCDCADYWLCTNGHLMCARCYPRPNRIISDLERHLSGPAYLTLKWLETLPTRDPALPIWWSEAEMKEWQETLGRELATLTETEAETSKVQGV